MIPFRSVLVSARTPSWSSRLILRFAIATLIITLSLAVGPSSQAFSVAAKSEEQKDIDRLYEKAITGEEYDAAIDGIIAYAERGDVNIYDRQYAFGRLEALAEPELKDYLRDVAIGEIEFEDSRLLREFSDRAYWVTRFREATDETDEERILVAALEAVVSVRFEGQNTPNNMGESRLVRRWAASELCRRGRSKHFDKIELSLDRYQSNEKAQKEIEFCRQKMEVLNKFDDRQTAFEYVLDTAHPTSEEQLINWAAKELIDLQPIDLEELLIDHIVRLFEEFHEDEIGFSIYVSLSYLVQNNWTREDFAARGIMQ